VVFYDSRNVSNTQAEIYMARSFDGGNSFENFLVSDHSFNFGPIPGFGANYAGDYIGIAAHNDVAYPYWMDVSTGVAQGWMATVSFGPPCPIDAPDNPNPANGTTDVDINLASISWTNGSGADSIEVWFEGLKIYNGVPVTSYPVPGPLEYSTTYSWRIVGKNDTCSTSGPTWTFTTMGDPNIVTLFCDDFTAGTGNWTITNDGGVCVWEIRDVSEYTLPPTAVGNCIAVDTDDCNGTSGNGQSTATHTGIDATNYGTVWLEFDNDWQALGSTDFAYVDVSTDGGSSWQNVLTFDVTDVRNTHEMWDLTTLVAGSVFDIRFKTVQPGWDWWWAVDNICIIGTDPVPVELTSFTAKASGVDVELNWSTATETNNQGFEVERKIAGGGYEQAGYVAGFGTTTEPKSYSFIDTDLQEGNYTYRIKQIDYDGAYEYSAEVSVEVEIPLEYSLEQNYPNPFNPATTIKYSLAEDGYVKLAVYNMLGEEVATVVNTTQKAGRYEVNFNAIKLSSGVYVYRIEAGNFTASKKLMLLK
jgi:hypothetical protein